MKYGRLLFFSCCLLMNLTCLILSLNAEERLKLIFFDIYSTDKLAREGFALTNQLKIQLVNAHQFEMLDRIQLQKIKISNSETFPDAPVERDKALDIGQALTVPFIIWGQIDQIKEELVVTLQLLNVVTREPHFTEEKNFKIEDITKVVDELAKKILQSATVATRTTLDDIGFYVKSGEFDTAYRGITIYHRLNKPSLESEELEKIITQNLARKHSDTAQLLCKEYLYTEALAELNQAVFLDATNTLYKELTIKIQKDKDEFATKKSNEIIQLIEELIGQKHFDSAQILLEQVSKQGAEPSRVMALQQQIQGGLGMRQAYHDALQAYRNGNYTVARLKIQEAINLNPEEKRYQEFMQKLNREELYLKQAQEEWQLYLGQIYASSPQSLFGANKKLSYALHFGAGCGGLDFMEATSIEKQSLAGTELDCFFLYHMPIGFLKIPVDFLAPYFSFYGGAIIDWGKKETTTGSGTFGTLERDSFFLSDIYGGAGATISCFSFYLGLGLGFNMGYLNLSNYLRDPLVPTETSATYHFFLPGIGTDFWLGWMINDIWSLNLKWRFRVVWPQGKELDWSDQRFNQVTISVGYKLLLATNRR